MPPLKAMLIVVCVLTWGCGGDDESTEQCCRVDQICEHCNCSDAELEIAESGNEGACESQLEGGWDCTAYDQSEAIAACLD